MTVVINVKQPPFKHGLISHDNASEGDSWVSVRKKAVFLLKGLRTHSANAAAQTREHCPQRQPVFMAKHNGKCTVFVHQRINLVHSH
jgi:hypothetical protein